MTAHAPAVEPPTVAQEAPAKEALTKEDEANRIIRQNVLWAAGGGVIPIPLVDMIAITVVNVKMLKELSLVYEVPFKEDQVKNIVASLLAGMGAPTLGMALTVSLVKAVPVIGVLSAFVAVPGLAAAFTYAVGKVFVQHFASGGTFLDFDPKKVREHFAREFEQGKIVATKVKNEPSAHEVS